MVQLELDYAPERIEELRRRRTTQEVSAHPKLVSVRNAVETAVGFSRAEAADVANRLSHQQCDEILAATTDAAIQHVCETAALQPAAEESR